MTTHDLDDLYLYDSDTAEMLTIDDLGISDDQYRELLQESLGCPQPEGHIRPDILDGRRVYAA